VSKRYRFKEGVEVEIGQSSIAFVCDGRRILIHPSGDFREVKKYMVEPIRTKLTPVEAFERYVLGKSIQRGTMGKVFKKWTDASGEETHYSEEINAKHLHEHAWYIPEDEE